MVGMGAGISPWNMNQAITHIATIVILPNSLRTEYIADTPAYELLLHLHADFAIRGGPTPGAEGTPRKRGPLPPPTCGRGRLPLRRVRALAGPGPQLPWPNARFHCRYELNEWETEMMRSRP